MYSALVDTANLVCNVTGPLLGCLDMHACENRVTSRG